MLNSVKQREVASGALRYLNTLYGTGLLWATLLNFFGLCQDRLISFTCSTRHIFSCNTFWQCPKTFSLQRSSFCFASLVFISQVEWTRCMYAGPASALSSHPGVQAEITSATTSRRNHTSSHLMATLSGVPVSLWVALPWYRGCGVGRRERSFPPRVKQLLPLLCCASTSTTTAAPASNTISSRLPRSNTAL